MYEVVSGLKSNFAVLINFLRLGGKSARTGVIRLPNATCIRARNAADTADIDLVCTDASNNVIVGGVTVLTTASGTYTPTLFNGANVASSTPQVLQYLRLGNTVTVAGRVDMTATAGGGATTVLGIELPPGCASTFVSSINAGGAGYSTASGGQGCALFANAGVSPPRLTLQYPSNDTTARSFFFSCTYVVL